MIFNLIMTYIVCLAVILKKKKEKFVVFIIKQ